MVADRDHIEIWRDTRFWSRSSDPLCIADAHRHLDNDIVRVWRTLQPLLILRNILKAGIASVRRPMGGGHSARLHSNIV